MALLIRHARVARRIVSIHVGTTIRAVGPELAATGDEELDVEGAAVLPGLHDHHVHLLARAAAADSVACGPPEVADEAALGEALAAADRRLPAGEWIRGIGYHESVAGVLDRGALDRIVANRPLRIQHRSGKLWILNSAGLRLVGSDSPNGRLWRQDEWLRARLPRRHVDLTPIGREAAAQGITGFTDATPHADPAELVSRAAILPQKVYVMSAPEAAHPGPAKVLLDDESLPSLDDLVDRLHPARQVGRSIAFHCVTHVQAALALAALEELGARPGDRLEHGALLSIDQVDQIRRLGVTVVTQPGLVHARGDRYLEDVEELGDLWRLGSLLSAGVAVAAGSDAPYGPSDPWVSVEAATTRRTVAGRVVGPDEAVSRATAIGLFQGHPDAPARARSISPGQPGDLCIVGRSGVEGAVVAGRLVYQR
ncbi:MAG: amidohydrolase family protein [Acidimicrobiales bacterium]|nr:amidohydrolase family protein [Acidimicrobiales bacterium]